jgi:hypothetical protein
MGEANSDYRTEQKYTYGDTYICDKNLKKLDFPEFQSFYKIEKLNETQQYIMLYGTDGNSRYAIVNDNGGIISQIDNYNYYEIKEDKIVFMNYDEFGDIEVDENGNLKEFIYSFK